VFEVVIGGHVLRVRLGRLLEACVSRQRTLAVRGAFAVDKAEDCLADSREVCFIGREVRVAAVAAGDCGGAVRGGWMTANGAAVYAGPVSRAVRAPAVVARGHAGAEAAAAHVMPPRAGVVVRHSATCLAAMDAGMHAMRVYVRGVGCGRGGDDQRAAQDDCTESRTDGASLPSRSVVSPARPPAFGRLLPVPRPAFRPRTVEASGKPEPSGVDILASAR
jgi:hypothetical protein